MTTYKELAEHLEAYFKNAHRMDEVIAILRSLDAQPVAWGLFAKVEDGEWNLQYPVRFTEDDANADRAMYENSTLIDIRPLYAAPVAAQQVEQASNEPAGQRSEMLVPVATMAAIARLLETACDVEKGRYKKGEIPVCGTYNWGNPELFDMVVHLKYMLAAQPQQASKPPEQDALRKRIKDFPLDDQDVPIIYDTNEIDLITYALTGDDGEDDSVTVLQKLVRALPGKTVYNLLEDAETAAQASGAVAAQPRQPYGWVRGNPGFASGVFQIGNTCPAGWVGSAFSVFVNPITEQPQQASKPLSDAEIFDLAEPFGAFEFGDAQGDKRLDFASAAITAFCLKNGIKEST